jgi:hypothetical protein
MSIAATEPARSPCSGRRAAANRRNARRSTGPRTQEGKARSSLNAVKTGCFARTPLLPGEEPAEMEAFVAEIIADLSPATAGERDLAERIAGLLWRRRRLWRAEEEVIAEEFGLPMDEEDAVDLEEGLEWAECDTDQHRADAELQSCPELAERAEMDAQAFLARQFAAREPGPLVRIANHERRLCGSIDAALRMLLKMQDCRFKQAQLAPNEPIEEGQRSWTVATPVSERQAKTWIPSDHEIQIFDQSSEPSSAAPNEPIAPPNVVNPAVNWISIAASAAIAVASRLAGDERTHRNPSPGSACHRPAERAHCRPFKS